MDSYKSVFKALEKHNVNYIIVGGVALNLHGCPRFTNDIDVLLALTEDNLSAMKASMDELGYKQRLPIAIDELSEEKIVKKYIEEKNLTAYTFVHPKEPLFSIDVIIGDSLSFDSYSKQSINVTAWDMELPVVSIDNLIDMKKKTDREKDALDVAMLLEYKGL